MAKIPFNVSARTARLIGRENVANAEGAVIELVKNGYDADAKNCIVYFDNKYYPGVNYLSKKDYQTLSDKSPLIPQSYALGKDGQYILSSDLGARYDDLMKFFLSQCSIFIIDNGHGMTKDIIENNWMTIGTDIKEQEYLSASGRVKTGAKGIGRFALDRLGQECEIYTLPKNKSDGFLWKANWSDFERQGAKIDDVNAELDEIKKLNLKDTLFRITKNFAPLEKILKEINLKHGTLIKINQPRDIWDNGKVKETYEYLEVLVPPKEQKEFDLHLLSSLSPNDFGPITSKICDDFDYKVTAEYVADEKEEITLTIERNELDINSIKKDYMAVFDLKPMTGYPYDFKTMKEKTFSTTISLSQLIPGYKEIDASNTLGKIGKFKFSFYFLKNSISSSESSKFPYKDISSATRKAWIERFGGIKIFRDNFRIRPYGDKGSDWLGLGKRQAESPGGAGQKMGGYRIRPNQILGAVDISRVDNVHFQDKSGREGLQENKVFDVFKQVLVGIVEYFENDRNTIMYSFSQLYKIKNAEEEAKRKAQEIADAVLKQNQAKDEKTDGEEAQSDSPESLEKLRVLSEGFKKQEEEIGEKDSELRLARSLASAGLIITSFSHELENLQDHLESRTEDLKEMLGALIAPDIISTLHRAKNPYILLDTIREQDRRLKHWLEFSLTALKKNRRERINIELVEYLNSFQSTWENLLEFRSIKLKTTSCGKFCVVRAFHIDLDSIFTNLIANSIEAFKRPGAAEDRIIRIKCTPMEDKVKIIYSDTGCGLSKDFLNPTDIFKPFVTTKRDINGNKTGTGLGMWIVKNILNEYRGDVNILTPEQGFAVEIFLPITKQKGGGHG